MLGKDLNDPTIQKICGDIPFPLITKSEMASGDASTHSFMIIKEKPDNWLDLKAKLLLEYKSNPFIVQTYIHDSANTVVKSMSFFGHFDYDMREGLNEATKQANEFEFVQQSTKSVKDESKLVDSKESETIGYIREFQLNLAKRLGMNLMGIDFVVDAASHKIYPIDLNKTPRLENIKGFRDILEGNFVKQEALLSDRN